MCEEQEKEVYIFLITFSISQLIYLSHKALTKVFKGNSPAVWPPCSVLKEQHCWWKWEKKTQQGDEKSWVTDAETE